MDDKMIKVRYINKENIGAYGAEGTVEETDIIRYERTGEVRGYVVEWSHGEDLPSVVTRDEVEIISNGTI
jgi:hypothetical protein